LSLVIFMINQITSFEVEMTLRCKHGDLAVIVGEYPGCETNIGRIVQVRGPAHLSEQCGELLCWVIRPISRKKMINLYIPDLLISERVTWKSDIKLPDCWLLPIRPPEDEIDMVEIESFDLKRRAKANA
jgi:hypothetical protein